MTATFCNVVTGPNTNGYGARSAGPSSGSSSSASGSSSGGGGPRRSRPVRRNRHLTNYATKQTDFQAADRGCNCGGRS
jgi:hypothetical protein